MQGTKKMSRQLWRLLYNFPEDLPITNDRLPITRRHEIITRQTQITDTFWTNYKSTG